MATLTKEKLEELKSILPRMLTLKCQHTTSPVQPIICSFRGKDEKGDYHYIELGFPDEVEAFLQHVNDKQDGEMHDLRLMLYDNRTVSTVWTRVPRSAMRGYINTGFDIEEGTMNCEVDTKFNDYTIECELPRR